MTAVEWLDSLSPWPRDGFGVDRMKRLLAELGDPQHRYPAVHVVGTNGKSTATVAIEQLLLADGLSTGATISPHVARWSERIRIDGVEADFERAVERVRDAAERLFATQFEIVTAAAFVAFAEAEVDAAVVEAGLGGRHDATNVLRSRVVLLTNVGLEHTEVLGDTVEAIAREKLAVVQPWSTVVLPDDTFVHLLPDRYVVFGGAHEAAEMFVDHSLPRLSEPRLPGRLEQRGGEIRDGAHNPDGAQYLVDHLRRSASSTDLDFTLVVSILADKDADAMLRTLRGAGSRLVATRSSSTRALPPDELATVARRHFELVEVVEDPLEAVARGHELGEPVLVTGSLYLLGDVAEGKRHAEWPARG